MFSGKSPWELLHKIRNDRELPIPAGEHNARIPVSVDCVVWKAIQKDPARRYEDCQSLVEELECCLSGKKPKAQLSRERRMMMDEERKKSKAKYADIYKKAFPPKEQK